MADTFNSYLDGVKKDTGLTKPPYKFAGLASGKEFTLGVSRVDEKGKESTVTTIKYSTKPAVIAVESITIAPKNATGTSLETGEKQFTATVLPAIATDKTVTWAVTIPKAGLTIDSKGLAKWTNVVGLAGAHELTATDKSGKIVGKATLTLTDKVGV